MSSSDSSSLTLEELDQHLFDCADILRGSIDSGRYKDYVLPLVFYAAVDGRFQKKVEENRAEAREDLSEDEMEQKARLHARRELGYTVPEPDEDGVKSKWEELTNTSEHLAKAIDDAFEEFEKENEDFENAFNNKFKNIESFRGQEGDTLLRNLLRRIDEIDFGEVPPDVMGEAYMDLVDRFSEADGGKYFTPPNVVSLLVELLEPFEKHSSFHDPTVGSGSMLVEAADQIAQRFENGEYEVDSEQDIPDFLGENFQFTGQERNPTITGIAKMNLKLQGLPAKDIRRGDSLSNPQFTKDGELEEFDYIMANPPFSVDGWKDDVEVNDEYGRFAWSDSLPHGNYGDYAFIMHMAAHLKDDGQLATLIPHGVLFRNSGQDYRQYMIDNDLVEAIIGLPENMFENTGIPSGILVLNKDKPTEREGEVLFMNLDDEDFYHDTGSQRNELLDEGIQRAKSNFSEWRDEERVSRAVSVDEIQENDYNLNIALYVDTTEPQEDISVENKLADIHDLETEYESLHDQLTTYMTQLNYESENND